MFSSRHDFSDIAHEILKAPTPRYIGRALPALVRLFVSQLEQYSEFQLNGAGLLQ